MLAQPAYRNDTEPGTPSLSAVPGPELPRGSRVGSDGELITPEAAEVADIDEELSATAAEITDLRERFVAGKA